MGPADGLGGVEPERFEGCTIVPGFVDCHTHLPFYGWRADEMAQQQKDVPSRAVYSLGHRASLVWERSVYNDAFSPSRLGWPLESVLTVVGAAWLAVRALRPGRGRPRAERQVFLWLAITWIGVSVGLGFLLQHYFVPTAMIATLLSGLAVGWGARAVWQLVRRWLLTSPPAPRLMQPADV